jgi:hypothetical protein
MLTLQNIQRTVNTLTQKYISKAKKRRFLAGVQSFSFQCFSSLNGAGRQLSANRLTGESRIRRTVNDTALSSQIRALVIREVFQNYSGYAFCSLDHSQFGPFCIAVLAISQRKGRAIPIWCQVNVSAAGLIAPLIAALEDLLDILASISPNLKLVLVMDRWFASERLMALIIDRNHYFIVRSKSDKLVQMPYDPSWWREPLGDITQEELPIKYRGINLWFVRSDYNDSMKDDEPWFLLTNLPSKYKIGVEGELEVDDEHGFTRRQILNRYTERFEIEEAFKDIKWLQRLEWQQIKKPKVIESLLHFVFLGWWLLWKLEGKKIAQQHTKHQKHQISWFRQVWEKLHTLSRPPELCFVS